MTTVVPEASAGSQPRIPDLEISIRLDGPRTLLFEIHAPDPALRFNRRRLGSATLPENPERYLYYLFKDIEGLFLEADADPENVEQRLAVKGATIWRLFPRELQEILWEWRHQPLTLLIQSEDPYIPWEMAKLQSLGPDGRVLPGPFLCEAFAVTRWLQGTSLETRLPLRNLALVVPTDSKLPQAPQERDEIRTLAEENGRQVLDIEPKFRSVCQELASGTYDGWHFTGHGLTVGEDADRWSIHLDDYQPLTAQDLLGETANLGLPRPLVFFNGCTTGRSGLTLTGTGGWPQRFLEANAGAFIGTYWSITDSKARELAVAFYRGLFQGLPIGEAFRQARQALHEKHPGNPTWLAYTVYAHPLASCADLPESTALRVPPADRKPEPLAIPLRSWRQDQHPPGALLRAQFGVVPFHRREKELNDLQSWCQTSAPVGVRLYTGPGGMGKTRLALEAAIKMKEEGWWTGFVTDEALRSPEETWKALANPNRKLLLVVDYAETNRPFLIPLLRELARTERGTVRLILLARAALDWWEQLKSEREGVGELLSGPAASRYSLQPLADSVEARAESYGVAANAFSERLQAPASEPPADLKAEYFQRVLLLHMKALIDMEGQEKITGEDGILDRILARERKFWETRTVDHGISREVAPGIGRAMAVITLGGGVQGEAEAIEALRGLRIFADQPAAVLTAVARLLHECYPGEKWIEPLQPDLLGEHLAQRELEQGADELFDLVLGPRGGG